MKTININGREYTESQFTKLAALKQAFVTYPEIAYGDVLIEAFEDLRDEFPRAEPSPPKLRPMSELPENKETLFNVLISANDSKWWDTAKVHLLGYIYTQQDAFMWKDGSFVDHHDRTLIGWLPLPNPNEIEL